MQRLACAKGLRPGINVNMSYAELWYDWQDWRLGERRKLLRRQKQEQLRESSWGTPVGERTGIQRRGN